MLAPSLPVLRVADVLAEACDLAYKPNIPAPSEWTYDKPLSIGDVQLRILANKNVGVIAITGSNSIKDFAAFNLDVSVQSLKGFQLHRGFTGYAETCKAAILSCKDLPSVFTRNWYCCGHSLGAAAAAILPILLHLDQEESIDTPDGVFGIGCPNYLLGDSAALYPIHNCVSVNSRSDLVGRLPAGFFSKPYSKAGTQFYIDDSGFSTYAGHELLRLGRYAIDLLSLKLFRSKPVSIAEHEVQRYINRLKLGVALVQQKMELIDA